MFVLTERITCAASLARAAVVVFVIELDDRTDLARSISCTA
jgi:hypothetical protein